MQPGQQLPGHFLGWHQAQAGGLGAGLPGPGTALPSGLAVQERRHRSKLRQQKFLQKSVCSARWGRFRGGLPGAFPQGGDLGRTLGAFKGATGGKEGPSRQGALRIWGRLREAEIVGVDGVSSALGESRWGHVGSMPCLGRPDTMEPQRRMAIFPPARCSPTAHGAAADKSAPPTRVTQAGQPLGIVPALTGPPGGGCVGRGQCGQGWG